MRYSIPPFNVAAADLHRRARPNPTKLSQTLNTGELHRISPEISTRGIADYIFTITASSTGEHPSITRDLLPFRSQIHPPNLKSTNTGVKRPPPKDNPKADRSPLTERSNDGTAKSTASREEGAAKETKRNYTNPQKKRRLIATRKGCRTDGR
ncbi:hypothetical protein Rs2_32393 [Raphanus sativus]|nr:hypothetical protein Rs2_32393 [Raphanus sativus]